MGSKRIASAADQLYKKTKSIGLISHVGIQSQILALSVSVTFFFPTLGQLMRLGNPINESFESLHIGRENSREHRKALETRGSYRPYSSLKFFRTYLSWKNSPATPMYSLSKSWANLSLLAGGFMRQERALWSGDDRRCGTAMGGIPAVSQTPPHPPSSGGSGSVQTGAPQFFLLRVFGLSFSCFPEEFAEFLAIPFFSRLRRLDDL